MTTKNSDPEVRKESPPSAAAPATAPSPTPAVPAPPGAVSQVFTKRPGVAAVLSLFPGLGHVYCGLYVRAAAFFTAFAAGIALADRLGELSVAIAFIYLFNVIDAYRQAELINHGFATDLGLHDTPGRPQMGQGALVVGFFLVLIGLYAILETYFHIDLEWIFDLWPFAVVAFGAWLIWSSLQDRRKAGQETEEEVF